jgi:hypothetical protein
VDIRLRPLREDEFGRFLRARRAEYVRGLVDEAGLTAEQAEEKSRADLGSLFPDGARQAHHRISEGLNGIDLNVWGRNDIARALYRTAGYYERAVAMSKELE